MLNIYIDGTDTNFDKNKVIRDVENKFGLLTIKGDSTERKIIELIEIGKYDSTDRFIDRYGIALSMKDLSTGCKAALQCYHNPDKIIDTSECGLNAIEAIIVTVRNGSILVHNNIWNSRGTGLRSLDDGNVDIRFDGHKFNSIFDFDAYINGDDQDD